MSRARDPGPRRRRWDVWRRVIPALLGALAVGGLVALPALEVRLEPQALLPDAPELDSAERELARRFDQPSGPAILVRLHAEDVLAPATLMAIDRLTEALAAHPAVSTLEGPTRVLLPVPLAPGEGSERSDGELDALLTLIEANPSAFPEGLASVAESTGGPTSLEPALAAGPERGAALLRRHRDRLGPLVSADGSSALLVLHLAAGTRWSPELLAGPLGEGAALRPELTGGPVLEDALRDALADDAPLLVALAMLGNALVLLLAMRSRRGVALPLGAAGISLSVLFLLMALAGQPFTLLHAMLPPLILTVAIADAIHILFRHQDNLDALAEEQPLGPGGRRSAIERTARQMAAACLVTSLTTAAGFGALRLAHTPAVRDLATWTAVGVAMAYVVTLAFVLSGLGGTPRHGWVRGAIGASAARAATRRPVAVLVGWCALGALGLGLGWQVEQGTRLLALFPDDLPAAEVARAVDRVHGGSRRMAAIAPDPATSRQLTDWLETRPEVTSATSAETLRARVFATLTPEPSPAPSDDASRRALGTLAAPLLDGWEDADGGQRIEVRLRDAPAATIVALTEGLRARGATAVVGEAARTSLAVTTIQEDLARTLGFALVTIFLFVGLLLRSIRLGLIALLPNLLPLAVGLGWMALRGIALDASTAMVFAASLGLAVDGTIHALVRFQVQVKVSPRGAIARSFREAGPGIVVGGATLLAGFAALFASDLPPVRAFAELATVTLAVATFAELSLLPALLRLFGGSSSVAVAAR